MQSDDLERAFALVTAELEHRFGEDNAITIDRLCAATGLRRRDCEELLEMKLSAFPFVIVAGSSGYFRPTSADQINHYLNSLQSRCVKVFLRRRTVMQKAKREGYPREGKLFTDPPSKQGELFSRSEVLL